LRRVSVVEVGHDDQVRIVGISHQDGAEVFEHSLAHGEDPTAAPSCYGYRTVRPLAARLADSVIELSLLVAPLSSKSRLERRPPGRDSDLVLEPDEVPQMYQRIAAYAVVTSRCGVLATEYSDRTGAPGRWGLPGGGIDPEEDPTSAVLREVAEETDQAVELGDLIAVHSGHWIGRSPRGDVEDFHAVRLVYAAECADPTTPRVLDVGGTTESARWVPMGEWSRVRWTSGWREVLGQLLPVS
jgi:ADP-ribose pyrophosphatase YjhB (NUDIX family)